MIAYEWYHMPCLLNKERRLKCKGVADKKLFFFCVLNTCSEDDRVYGYCFVLFLSMENYELLCCSQKVA